MQNIGIIDYGSGNIFSLLKAFQHLGFRTEVSSNPTKITDFSHLVIPGVGAFSSAMELLCTGGFIDPIHDAIKRGTRFWQFVLEWKSCLIAVIWPS